MKATNIEFEGQDIFISVGARMHRVYPARLGYWADIEGSRGGVETRTLVVDDFGNLVDVFGGARQRAIFRQNLH